jgi:UDP-N-acetylglucosamine 2-epimerase (non-hydrolysing)
VTALIELAAFAPLVFPVHPRTLDRLEGLDALDRLERSNVVVTPPLGYLDFLGLEAEAEFVLTDSGGVQEETSALGVPCFTLRDTTERPVTVDLGTNTLLGLDPGRLVEIPALLARPRNAEPIPLWDGEAGVRSARVVATFLEAVADGVLDVRR